MVSLGLRMSVPESTVTRAIGTADIRRREDEQMREWVDGWMVGGWMMNE